MKKRIINHLAVLLTLAIVIVSVPIFGLKAYASEVDASSEDAPAETTTEQEEQKVVQVKKVTIDGITYEILSEQQKTAKVTGSAKTIKTATIKPTVKINNENYKVIIIMSKAFANRKSLKKVVIGKNIKAISKRVFVKDAKLKTVVFKGKELIVVMSDAFKGTNKKITFKIPKKVFKKYKMILSRTALPKKAKFIKY